MSGSSIIAKISMSLMFTNKWYNTVGSQAIINISCPRKRIKNRGMSCNLLWVPTFLILFLGQEIYYNIQNMQHFFTFLAPPFLNRRTLKLLVEHLTVW